jgi:RimJ/RimL family protein N-acetyltransferase
MEHFSTERLIARDWTAGDVVYLGNLRSLAVCRRLGMIHRGQTDRYYGVTLELFSASRATARTGAEPGPA